MVEQTFLCDLCRQETLLTERCRDEKIFALGWVICAHCGPCLRQRLIPNIAGQQVDKCLEQYYADSLLEVQRGQYCSQNEEAWIFPHVSESTYQYAKKYRGCIDAYTASYMRWKNKLHVSAWLASFDHQHALRPVFLDTETTGSRRFSEVIEICVVDEYGQTLFRSLVNPSTEIEPMATTVHGLTRRDVKNAPRFPEIYEELTSYLRDRVVIAYNASFDIRLLKQTADCYELVFPALHTGCLMYAYAKYREEYVTTQRRCKTWRLEEAMMREQLDMPPSHRAERDAKCVYQLFQAMKVQS